jgi:hypothetical protein
LNSSAPAIPINADRTATSDTGLNVMCIPLPEREGLSRLFGYRL